MTDTLKQFLTVAEQDLPGVLHFGLTFAAALIILFAGFFIAGRVRKRLASSTLGGDRISRTLRPVLASTVFYLIIAFTLYAFLTKVGVPSGALLAIFGSAGLAVGLALKDTLGNIAAGVMMLILRPLKVGESVAASNYAGTVQEIGLFATTLKDREGLYIYVPNIQMWNNRLKNYARHTERKLIMDINVAYDTDLRKAQEIMLKAMGETPDVKTLPAAPQCFVTNFGDSGILLSARCWLPAEDWTARTSDIRIRVKEALDAAGIEIPYRQPIVIPKPSQ